MPRRRDDVFLPVFKPWDGAGLSAALEAGYRRLGPTWDEGTEDKLFRSLLDVFRHKKWAGAELPALKPTVGEALANSRNLVHRLLAYDPDYPGYSYYDIIECSHPIPELEALLRQSRVLHNQYRWDREKSQLVEVGQLGDDDIVVVFHPRSDEVLQFLRRGRDGRRARLARPVAAEPQQPMAPLPPTTVRQRFTIMPRPRPTRSHRPALNAQARGEPQPP